MAGWCLDNRLLAAFFSCRRDDQTKGASKKLCWVEAARVSLVNRLLFNSFELLVLRETCGKNGKKEREGKRGRKRKLERKRRRRWEHRKQVNLFAVSLNP